MTGPFPRVLIISLYSGENEFEQCRAALQGQSHSHWEHRVFEGLGNKDAHIACYSEFMSRPGFDLFIKLDADMVLVRECVLEEIVRYFAARQDLDHAVFSVHDFASDADIMGLHVFSNRASWPLDDEQLFVDPSPDIPGQCEFVWGPPAPVALHSPDPSEKQLFSFGVHRALKALQFGRVVHFRPVLALEQWKLLVRTAGKFSRTSDRRLLFSLYGAELVRRREIVLTNDDYKGDVVAKHFETTRQMSTEALQQECAFWLGPRARRMVWWAGHIGWRAGIGGAKRLAPGMAARGTVRR